MDWPDRFWSKVDKSGECWLWLGAIGSNGYGFVSVNRKAKTAHTTAWLLVNGPIPQGLFVCHHCDVRRCVNPNHLFVGTQRDNMRDAARKGRVRVPGFRGEENRNSRLTTDEVLAIRAARLEGLSSGALARKFGIARSTALQIVNGQTWKHV